MSAMWEVDYIDTIRQAVVSQVCVIAAEVKRLLSLDVLSIFRE